MKDREYYFHRYLDIIHDLNLPEGDNPPVPPEERRAAVAGLAQARAMHTAQLLFNLFPMIELTKERIEDVTEAGINAMVEKFKEYLRKHDPNHPELTP